jgi:protein transport protein SEC24
MMSGGPPSGMMPPGGPAPVSMAPPPSKSKPKPKSKAAHVYHNQDGGVSGSRAPALAGPQAAPATAQAPQLFNIQAFADSGQSYGPAPAPAPMPNQMAPMQPMGGMVRNEPQLTNFQRLAVVGAGGPNGGAAGPDAAMCPRPITFVRSAQFEEARGAGNCKMPPATEPGQCDPALFRVSTNAIPSTNVLKQKWGLPFGAVIHPMATIQNPGGVPLVNFGSCGIIRCRRCRTYINPFVQFVQGGQRWKCNVCGLINDVPPEYFCVLDGSGRRRDLAERPELCHGHVEFVAPAEYMVRPPQPPVYFFVIDVSYNAVASGMLQCAVNSIMANIEKLNGEHTGGRTKVGIMTFDSALHFYNLKSSLSRPQMLVVTDVNEVYTPLNEGLLVDLADSLEVVQLLVESLPEMFASTQNTQSALGPALQGAYMVMQHLGGKMIVMQTTMPNLGVGKLRNRDNPRVMGTDKERTHMQPEELFYKRLGVECSRNQICVDMLIGASSFMDVASMAPLSKFTGGQVSYFSAFRAAKDAPEFESTIARILTRETGTHLPSVSKSVPDSRAHLVASQAGRPS